MAGIEIIGLVLGALQLTISALENYHRGLAPLKDYIRYDNTLKSLRTRLRIQQDLFEGTLQCLLFEELSDGQAKSLFPDANLDVDISLWRSPEIEAKLHRKLDTKYQNFVDVIEEMDVLMRQLKKKLNVDTEEKPNWDAKLPTSLLPGHERGKWEWRKIRRSFGRKEREALIQKLERDNAIISEFVKQREILAPASKARPEKFLKYYHVVQENACGLYDALEAGWKCQCLSSHNANLQLECPDTAHSSPVFKVFLSFLNRPSQDKMPQKTWLEAQVNVDELDKEIETEEQGQRDNAKAPDSRPRSTFFPTTNAATTSISLPSTSGKNAFRSVKIIEPNGIMRQSPKLHAMPTPNPSVKKSQRPRISSLCEALQTVRKQSTTLCFLPDFPRNRCISIKMANSIRSDLAEPISLGTLLSSSNMASQRHRPFGTLTRKQRTTIAVTLAHAILQLHKSPWLNEGWSKGDIYFFPHGVDSYQRPVIDHPHVSRSFEQRTQPQVDSCSTKHVADFSSSLIINKSLFALGIVLIELSLNRPFEDLCLDARDPNAPALEGPPSVLEIYSVATSLIEAVYEEQGTEYGYVVQRCLKCEFGIQDSKKQLDFDAFRALVYEGVLAPLERCAEKFSLV